MVVTISSIPYALIQCEFGTPPSCSRVYVLPLNLSMLVTMVNVTLGHKNMHFHRIALRYSFLELSHPTVSKPNQP